MKTRNYYVYGDSETLRRLAEEYRYIGREIVLEESRLIVLALPIRKPKRKKTNAKHKPARQEND